MADTNSITIDRILLRRLFSKVQISTEHFYNSDPCWEWTASKFPTGYGQYNIPGHKTRLAHKAFYLTFVGDVPDGLVLDHLCKNIICVNPAHLEPVTQAENLYRSENFTGINMRKTHCIRGHPFAGDNLYLHQRKSGRMKGRWKRSCRACLRIRSMQITS